MTLPLIKATNSLFKCCGKKGIYQGRSVLFILSEPDEVVGIGFVKTQSSTIIMRLRVSDAPDLSVDDKIETDDLIYQVIAEPRKDIHAIIWMVEVICN